MVTRVYIVAPGSEPGPFPQNGHVLAYDHSGEMGARGHGQPLGDDISECGSLVRSFLYRPEIKKGVPQEILQKGGTGSLRT